MRRRGFGLSGSYCYTKTFASLRQHWSQRPFQAFGQHFKPRSVEGSLESYHDHIVLCPISAGMSMALVAYAL